MPKNGYFVFHIVLWLWILLSAAGCQSDHGGPGQPEPLPGQDQSEQDSADNGQDTGNPPTPPLIGNADANHRIAEIAQTLQAGDWVELETNHFYMDIDGEAVPITKPPSGRGNILEYMDEAVFDPVNEWVYIIGCAVPYHCGGDDLSDTRWIRYHLSNNTWEIMPQTTAFQAGFHTYDHAALDTATGEYHYRVVGSDEIWVYKNGQWSPFPDPLPLGYAACCSALEYMAIWESLVFIDSHGNGGFGQVLVYKLRNNDNNAFLPLAEWYGIPLDKTIGGYHNITEYNPVQELLYIAGGEEHQEYGRADRSLLMLHSDGSVTQAAESPVVLGNGGGNRAVHSVDPKTGHFLVFANGESNGLNFDEIHEYNPEENQWTATGRSHPLVGTYDMETAGTPLWDYNVLFFVKADGLSGSKVYLYRHSD